MGEAARPAGERSCDPADLLRLVGLAQAGVLDQQQWFVLLEELRRLTRADYASFVVRRAGPRLDSIAIVSPGRTAPLEAPATPWQSIESTDEVLREAGIAFNQLVSERPYALADLARPGNPGHARYLDYLRQRDIGDSRVVRIGDADAWTGWLSLATSSAPFAVSTNDLLALLAPHLTIAARTLASLERERLRGNIAEGVVQRLNFGWVTLDGDARIIAMDDVAGRVLGSLEGEQAMVGKAFPGGPRGKVRQAVANFARQDGSGPKAVHLADDPWHDMLLIPIAAQDMAIDTGPVAIGYVHGVDSDNTERCEHLRQLFGLTTSEARLAVALSQGKTIAKAADSIGLTVETARFYTKRIYAKTDTRGQADLVRLILASVIALS